MTFLHVKEYSENELGESERIIVSKTYALRERNNPMHKREEKVLERLGRKDRKPKAREQLVLVKKKRRRAKEGTQVSKLGGVNKMTFPAMFATSLQLKLIISCM